MKSVDKDPARRYQSATEMCEALEKFEREALPEQRSPGDGETRIVAAQSRKSSMRPGILAGGITLALLIGFLLYRQFTPHRSARLSLASVPAGATVMINGTPVGISPLTDYTIEPGTTPITVILTGFKSRDTTLSIVAEEVLNLMVSLERLPPDSNAKTKGKEPEPVRQGPDGAILSATLIVRAVPSGSVVVDGASRVDDAKRSTEVEVQAGKRTITFSHPRYGPKSFIVDVKAGDRRKLTCYFEAYISIIAQPVWAKIVIDGRNTDLDTPLDRYPLGPGRHTITVTRSGYMNVEGAQEIVVEPAIEEKVIPLVFTLKKQ